MSECLGENIIEKLYVLGTGNAAAVDCYNTCFAISDGTEFIQVDAGGGNGILRILRDMRIPLSRIHHLIVTHEHADHVLGVIWMVRMIASAMLQGRYAGNLNIYAHDELLQKLRFLFALTLQPKVCALLDDRIKLTEVQDGETRDLNGYPMTFFDIHSTKARQFGFTTTLHNSRRLTCLGDEPCHPACRQYAEGVDWLLHEAFCLYDERERFKPYEKHHSTVRDAAIIAQELDVQRLILWHTEDTDQLHRKVKYIQEASKSYKGCVFVPNDGEKLEL